MNAVVDSNNYSENIVAQSLIQGDVFFTQLVIVGKYDEMNNVNPPHFDEEYIILCIVTLGSPINGLTNNYDSLKKIGLELKKILYTIYHGVCSWNGNRITLNSNLNKSLNIFNYTE